MKTKLLLFILIFSTTVLSANNVIERGDDVKAITSWQSLNQFNHSRENGLKIWIEQPEIQLDSVVDILNAQGAGQKYSFTYSLSARKEVVVLASRASSASKWINAKRKTTIYNLDGSVQSIMTENSSDNDDSVFELWSLVTYDYDENAQINSRLTQLSFGANWVDTERIVYEYNDLNQLVSEISQMKDGDSWSNSMLMTYSYDVSGNLESSIRNYSNGEGWSPNYKEEYTYNEDGSLASYTSARASFFGEGWNNGDHIRYEYDENGVLLVEQPYSWNMATESWEIDIYGNVVYYSYDPSGRLYKGEKTVCYSDSECYGERFHLGFTNAYVENIVGAHNMLYELNLFGSNDFSELPLMSLSTETIGGSTWELSLNRNIYYSNYVASSVVETELNKEVIYVNNRTIYLEELQTVSVFSVTGGVVFSGTASSIEIAQPGVYVVRTARGVHKLVIS